MTITITDNSEIKRFETLDEGVKYMEENYFSSFDARNIDETFATASLEREGFTPISVSKHIGNVAPLVKKYNLESVDDLDYGAVKFATLHMEMPYLYTKTYDNKVVTYGVRKIVKEVLKLFFRKAAGLCD